MEFDDRDRADESEVEDRRGMRFPGGGFGMGVGGLGLVGGVIYLAIQCWRAAAARPAPPSAA